MNDPLPRLHRRAVLQGGLAVSVFGGFAASGASAAASPRSTAQQAAPTIAGTADWGARQPTESIEIHESAPTFIVVHHTATENTSDTSQQAAFDLAQWIQDLHMDSNGWGDSGQNFTNSRGGWLLEGRHQSLPTLQEGTRYVEGIHAGDGNYSSQGIENEGLYTDEDVPTELWDSLVALCAHICAQYNIPAGEIYGHRDYMATECPGEILYGRLPELREAVGAALGATVIHPVTWPLLKPGQSGPRVAAAQHLLRAQGAPLTVNGTFDDATRRAVEDFAAKHQSRRPRCTATRLDEPGLLGADLLPLLAPTLNPGSEGAAVRALHLLLTTHGQHPDQSTAFGARTDSAVRAFQGARATKTSGVVDHTTWKLLFR